MIGRLRQFLKGMGAYVTKDDMAFVERYLSQREKEVFVKLPRHEIRHAVGTAKSIKSFSGLKDEDMLVKAALLHDIGKSKGRLGIVKKSILVIFDKFLPQLSRRLSCRVSMFNIYYNHPEIGAEILSKLGTDEKIILLVKYHHSEKKTEIEGMEELKRADSLN